MHIWRTPTFTSPFLDSCWSTSCIAGVSASCRTGHGVFIRRVALFYIVSPTYLCSEAHIKVIFEAGLIATTAIDSDKEPDIWLILGATGGSTRKQKWSTAVRAMLADLNFILSTHEIDLRASYEPD